MAFPTYGRLQLGPFTKNPQTAVRRTEMETGPAKQAKIKSRVMKQRSISMRYSNTEFNNFESWFVSADCNYGASWFDWVDPFDGTTKQTRIVGGEYQAAPQYAGEGSEPEWLVTMTFEIWNS